MRHTVDTLRTTTVKDSVNYFIFEIILLICVGPFTSPGINMYLLEGTLYACGVNGNALILKLACSRS